MLDKVQEFQCTDDSGIVTDDSGQAPKIGHDETE